jgi:hypothetical protein
MAKGCTAGWLLAGVPLRGKTVDGIGFATPAFMRIGNPNRASWPLRH